MSEEVFHLPDVGNLMDGHKATKKGTGKRLDELKIKHINLSFFFVPL